MSEENNSNPENIVHNVGHADLVEFYEGQVSDPKRHTIEEFLIDSQYALLEFFSIKRDRELPAQILPSPSANLKEGLDSYFMKYKPADVFEKKRWLAAAAVLLFVLGALMLRDDLTDDFDADSAPLISIDAASDQLASSTTFM